MSLILVPSGNFKFRYNNEELTTETRYDEDDNISYYKLIVTDDMKAINTGQYDYEISDELSVLSTGILQVGSFNYTSSQTKYQTQKEIKTYEAE